MKRQTLRAYAFILPVMILAIVFVYMPFIQSVVSSFFTVRMDSSLAGFAGMENYRKLFGNEIFHQSLSNTFLFMILFVPLNIILIMAAVLLTERKSLSGSIFETVFMLPMAVGMSSAALIFKYMFRPSVGIINSILHVDIPWTDNAFAAMFSVVLLGVFLDFGLDYILLLSAMRNLDRSVLEAAQIDGAGKIRLFASMKLPLISPTLFFVIFISIKDALLICAPVMVMTEGGPFRSTQTVVYYYYIEAFKNSNYSAAFAISTIVFVIATAITAVSFRIDRRVHYEN